MATLRRVHAEVVMRPDFPAGLRCLLVDTTLGEQQEAQMLKQCAYDVTSASCAEEALEALASAKASGASFDILLAEAATLSNKALRDCVKELPTIVICEAPKPEEVMHNIKLGVAEVLERPLCPLKLKNIWQHSVRRLMRSASAATQLQMHQGGAQQQQANGAIRKANGAAAGRRTSQEGQAASSQNGSSTAPELSFCPVTPVATTAAMGAAAAAAANQPLFPSAGSPMSCGAAPTFNHHVNGKARHSSAHQDGTTATSSPPFSVHDSVLYAPPPPSTPAPPATGLLRAGSHSGTLTSTDDSAGAGHVGAAATPTPRSSLGGGLAGAARVLGVKRKSKDMSRAGSSGSSEAATMQGQPLQAQRPVGGHEEQQQQQQVAVVSGDDLLLPHGFGALVDELTLGAALAGGGGVLQAPAGSSVLDATAGVAAPTWPAPAPLQPAMVGSAVGLPAGMAWGMPLNPAAVAPGITPPIFPVPAGPVMPHPLAPPLWPAAAAPLPGCVMPGMVTPPGYPPHPFMSPPAFGQPMMGCMPGMCSPTVFGNPGMMAAASMMAGGVPPVPPTPQLPALPMSMLMGACGGGGAPGMDTGMQAAAGFAACFAGAATTGCAPQVVAGLMMGSPCSPAPTDPSIMNSSHLSEHSVQDMLGMGVQDEFTRGGDGIARAAAAAAGAGKGLQGCKMGRCESHQLLPSLLDELMADGDADMELELDALSLTADLAATPATTAGPGLPRTGCGAARAAPAAMMALVRRNDSLDDLIGSSVVAF